MYTLKLCFPVAEALGWAVLLLKLQRAEEGKPHPHIPSHRASVLAIASQHTLPLDKQDDHLFTTGIGNGS